MAFKERGIRHRFTKPFRPQTISGQIQLLEEAMGSALFAKSGRSLVLTDAGRLVLGYAEEIFSMGAELSEAVREHKAKGRLLEFKVGVVDAVPKAIAYRLLEPATQLPERVRIVCREGKLEGLLAALAMHRLDLVISDTPMPTSISVKAFNHQLGASGVSFFAAPALVETFEGPFPRCLDGARMLMPGDDSAVGRRLRAWFQERSLQPLVVGEFDDSALAKEFGRRGAGVFVAPTVLAKEIERQFGVKDVGAAAEVLAEFFAISVERRVTHPCVVAITQAARNELFAPPANARRTRRLASL